MLHLRIITQAVVLLTALFSVGCSPDIVYSSRGMRNYIERRTTIEDVQGACRQLIERKHMGSIEADELPECLRVLAPGSSVDVVDENDARGPYVFVIVNGGFHHAALLIGDETFVPDEEMRSSEFMYEQLAPGLWCQIEK